LLTIFRQSANRIDYFDAFASKRGGLGFDPELLRSLCER
jgi:hypothetical protein